MIKYTNVIFQMSTSVPRQLTTARGISCVKIAQAAMSAFVNQATRSELIGSVKILMNVHDSLGRYEKRQTIQSNGQ